MCWKRLPEFMWKWMTCKLKYFSRLKYFSWRIIKIFFSTWKLSDLCYKTTMPETEIQFVETILDRLFPCAIITPLDCFWEGAEILGPDFPVHIPWVSFSFSFIKTSPSLTVSCQLTSDWPITHLQLMHSTHFIAHFPILSSRAINVDNILYNLHLILTYWGWFDGQINVQIPIIYDLLNGNLFYLIQTRLDLLEISNET